MIEWGMSIISLFSIKIHWLTSDKAYTQKKFEIRYQTFKDRQKHSCNLSVLSGFCKNKNDNKALVFLKITDAIQRMLYQKKSDFPPFLGSIVTEKDMCHV